MRDCAIPPDGAEFTEHFASLERSVDRPHRSEVLRSSNSLHANDLRGIARLHVVLYRLDFVVANFVRPTPEFPPFSSPHW